MPLKSWVAVWNIPVGFIVLRLVLNETLRGAKASEQRPAQPLDGFLMVCPTSKWGWDLHMSTNTLTFGGNNPGAGRFESKWGSKCWSCVSWLHTGNYSNKMWCTATDLGGGPTHGDCRVNDTFDCCVSTLWSRGWRQSDAADRWLTLTGFVLV